MLIGVGPAYIGVIVVHVPVPGGRCIEVRRTPPVTDASNEDVWSIGATEASRKSCETRFIGCPCIWGCPMGGSGFFKFATSNTFTSQIVCQSCPLGIGWYMPACGAYIFTPVASHKIIEY